MGLRIGTFVLLWALSGVTPTVAETSATLGLPVAVARVLEHNPKLQSAEFDAVAAAVRIRQQQQPAPWSVGVEAENFAGTGLRQGFDSLETTLSLGRVLELGDKPALRGEVARHEAGLLRHDLDAQRLDLLAEAARRYLDIAKVQAQRKLAQDRVELLQRTLQAINERIRVGKSPTAQRGRVEIDLGRAQLALEETEHLMRVARRRLAVLWGEFEPDFQWVSAELLQVEAEPDFQDMERRLENNPAVARLATRERLATARIRLARASRQPDVDVRAGVKYFADADDMGFAVSMRVPLGSASRAVPHIDEARTQAKREPLLARDRRLELRVTLFELQQELVHSRDRLQALREKIIPAARETLEDYTDGFRLGRYSLLELLEAQRSLLQARMEVIDAAVNHHAFFIEIDRLIGANTPLGETP